MKRAKRRFSLYRISCSGKGRSQSSLSSGVRPCFEGNMSPHPLVRTVLGSLPPHDLGMTLCHEHMSMIFDVAFCDPDPSTEHMSHCPLTVENLGWIRQHPHLQSQAEFALGGKRRWRNDDLRSFKACGGRPETVLLASVEELAAKIKSDIREGTEEEPSVSCGIIGEIGTSFPLTDFEKRSLQAAALAQIDLAAEYASPPPVNIHPGRNQSSPAEVSRVFAEAGGHVRRLCMSHVERTLLSDESLFDFASEFPGCYLEFDLFGNEVSYYQLNPEVDFPSDADRIRRIKSLIDEKYTERILVAHDVHTRHRLTKFGGHGYQYLLDSIIPRMKMRGFSFNDIQCIFNQNPAHFLPF
ncbi:unnamed protein product [Cyprideis torosa]|uniref:Phosphotriesterase-related protein n=1 Tax=Cyprideis torosa TaxID=163714 RepID=A0A7R8WCL1_9CRUS|nr:unnamed protein product [Cyprideis torosa]CAG0893515.1 unnamed protein product [Cyprideis torosa]